MAVAVLLLASCHRKTDPVVEDEATPPTAPCPLPDTMTLRDTAKVSADGVKNPSSSTTMTLQIDTAELTNLRLFGRKQKTIYDPHLLVGEWVLEGWHMVIDSNGHGERWNEKEDIRRDEADAFVWAMDSNLLTFEFQIAMGTVIPKLYLVTFLDRESLVYRNAYGTSYMWDRPPIGSE